MKDTKKEPKKDKKEKNEKKEQKKDKNKINKPNVVNKKDQKKDKAKKKDGKKVAPLIIKEEDKNTVFINSTINEIYAVSEVTQYFVNDEVGNPIELKVSFPIKPEIQLVKFIISIGEKTVISKVMAKEKAKEKYSDSIASGNTGFLSEFNDSYSRYTINVGNILPKEKVKLVSTFNQLITSSDMSYEFSFMEHYPCFIYHGTEVNAKKVEGKLVFNTNSKITRLIAPFMDEEAQKSISYKIDYNENYTQATIHFNKNLESEMKGIVKVDHPKIQKTRPFRPRIESPPHLNHHPRPLNLIHPLIQNIHPKGPQYPGLTNRFTGLNYFKFLFRTEKMNTPILYSQFDPKTKETAYCLNYIYSSKNVKNIPVPAKPDEDNNISYYEKYQENLINETPALFIFLVDQSGSMKGEAIELVKKALTLFMQSLPAKSYFQIIGFGSIFTKYHVAAVEYNKINVSNTLKQINNMKATMGGTNISSPLQDIFENNINNYDSINLARNIFLLTDGQVHNRERCIDLISANSNRFRIHAIGIGHNFDKVLIERSGKLGNGTSSFVEDVSKINSVIIDTLNKSIRPYLVNLKFSFNNDNLIHNPILINEPVNNFTYQDEIISYGFILDNKNMVDLKKLKQPIKVDITADDPINNIKESIDLINQENIIQLKDGENLLKILVGQGLKYNKKLTGSTETEVEFAKKYQLLSKNTALFGEILQDGNTNQEKLIKVELDIERRKILANARNRSYGKNIRKYKMTQVPMRRTTITKCVAFKSLKGTLDKPTKAMKGCNFTQMYKSYRPMTANANKIILQPKTFKKQISFSQKEDGSIRIVDEFKDVLLTQDVIEGYWDNNIETKKLAEKKKEKFKKISEFVKNLGISEDFNKIVFTIFVLDYIQNEKKNNLNEYKLILNKGKKFLMSKGINFDEEIKKMF